MLKFTFCEIMKRIQELFLCHLYVCLLVKGTLSNALSSSTETAEVISSIENGGLYFKGFDDTQMAYIPTVMRSMKVSARVLDGISEVSMVQEFQTPVFFPESFGDSNLAVYQVPLDELAAVTEFRAEIPSTGRIIDAKVKEREEARQEFEKALEKGKTAYLAEQVRADIFSISVGNLPKDTIVRITLVYVTILETLGANTLRFVFPTAVSPRYHPVSDSLEGPIPSGQALINDGVKIELDVSMGAILDKISSNTHDLQVSFSEQGLLRQRAHVEVTDENPTDRDVVIMLHTLIEHTPQIYVESSTEYESTAIMLSIVPNISDDLRGGSSSTQVKQEFIFILDRSGSMSGDKITQTRQAMSYIISNKLPSDCIFNIISFGDSFSSLFKEGSRPINDAEVKSQALNLVESMDADYGGTEIFDPIKHALGEEPLSDYERVVFLLTDGEVSNTKEIIEYVRSRRGSGRVFTLGIGPHASALLVRGVARAGEGTAEFVNGDEIEAAVQRQMEVAATPALTDVRIDWGVATASEDEGQQGPFQTPPLLTGKRFLVFYLLPGVGRVPDTVRISSRIMGTDAAVKYEVASSSYVMSSSVEKSINNGTLDQIVHNMSSNSQGEDLVHKITCRTLIRDLEEGGSILHEKDATREEIREEIVRLGVKYQIASSETSFVAVDNKGWTESSELGFGDEMDADYGYARGAGSYSSGARSSSSNRFAFLFAMTSSWLWILECFSLGSLAVFL